MTCRKLIYSLVCGTHPLKSLAPCILSVLLLGVAVQQADAGTVYFEDFNTDAGGWRIGTFGAGPSLTATYTYQSSGGVGNSGYIEVTRNDLYAFHGAQSGDASANLLGDLEAIYGNKIEFSYAARIFEGPTDREVRHLFFNPNGQWRKTLLQASEVSPLRTDWTTISFEIDTNWSDAEAIANGWVNDGTLSWTGTLHAVTFNTFFRPVGQSFGTNITGIDDVTVQSVQTVPEPSSIILLGIGGIALVGYGWRRKRQAA